MQKVLNKAYSVTVKAEELLGPGAMGDDDTLHVKHSSVSQEGSSEDVRDRGNSFSNKRREKQPRAV